MTREQDQANPVSSDTENFSNKQSLGFRVVLSILGWIALSYAIPSGKFYFSSIFLFITPIGVDYIKYNPVYSDRRKKLKSFALFVCVAFFIFCFVGFFGMDVKDIDNIKYVCLSDDFLILKSFKFEVTYLWLSLIIIPILTIIDYFAHATVQEINLSNAVDNVA